MYFDCRGEVSGSGHLFSQLLLLFSGKLAIPNDHVEVQYVLKLSTLLEVGETDVSFPLVLAHSPSTSANSWTSRSSPRSDVVHALGDYGNDSGSIYGPEVSGPPERSGR